MLPQVLLDIVHDLENQRALYRILIQAIFIIKIIILILSQAVVVGVYLKAVAHKVLRLQVAA